MANEKPTIPSRDYHDTKTYQGADPLKKRQLERYKTAFSLPDEQLFLLLHLQDVKDLPPEEKRAANRPAETMVVSGILFFLVAAGIGRKAILLIAIALLFFMVALYLSGNLSTYSYELKLTHRKLKQYPAVPPFEAWAAEHPEAPPQAVSGKKTGKNHPQRQR